MSKRTHDDERIYVDMAGKVSKEDLVRVSKVTLAWADALDKMDKRDTTLRIVFLACFNTIATMGPAYCKLAAINLMKRAEELYREQD